MLVLQTLSFDNGSIYVGRNLRMQEEERVRSLTLGGACGVHTLRGRPLVRESIR